MQLKLACVVLDAASLGMVSRMQSSPWYRSEETGRVTNRGVGKAKNISSGLGL